MPSQLYEECRVSGEGRLRHAMEAKEAEGAKKTKEANEVMEAREAKEAKEAKAEPWKRHFGSLALFGLSWLLVASGSSWRFLRDCAFAKIERTNH